jgi:hypothetical protein
MDAQGANKLAKNFADKHGISVDAAKKIQKAFDGLESNGLASLSTIGLNKADMKAMVRHNLPASSSIARIADKLDMSQAQARDLLLSLDRDFSAKAANIHSNYWQTCMQGGHWSTPQNRSCQSASERGCSPATGASMCY